MPEEDWLPYVPPLARCGREPLPDHRNALVYWDEAVHVFVPLDDEALYDRLVAADPDTRLLAPFPSGGDAERLRRFLRDNRQTLELLQAGVRCGQAQFPEPEEEGGSVAEHASSLRPLSELANLWLILCRSLMAEGERAAAAAQLIDLGRMGQITCGAGLLMHYLIGTAIRSSALEGMRLLATGKGLSCADLRALSAAVEGWIACQPDEAAQCLRRELCWYALREIECFGAGSEVEPLVDKLLERYYSTAPLSQAEEPGSGEARDDNGRTAWRRQCIVRLLEGHPEPFDRVGTVRLMGQLVADRIEDLGPRRWFGGLGRLARAYRRSRFRSRVRRWPRQLCAAFPYYCLGPGEDAQRCAHDHLRDLVSAREWSEMQPPSDAELESLRRQLRYTPNPLGVLVADALLGMELFQYDFLDQGQLFATCRALHEAMARSGDEGRV